MGDLSEHYNHKDFICPCDQCRGKEFKIHLGLVGILEQIGAHFNTKVNVLSAFWCDAYLESLQKERKSYHNRGKAVHINIDGIDLSEIFKYVEGIDDINGIGLYPKEGYIHIDTRPKEKRKLWVKEGSNHVAITPEKRKQYKL